MRAPVVILPAVLTTALALAALPPETQDRPIHQAERAHDRIINRVTPEPLHELDRIQQPLPREFDEIQRDLDRQEILDRQARDARLRELKREAMQPRPTTRPALVPAGPFGSRSPDADALAAEVLEATVAYERATRQAEAELANDPDRLRARLREVGLDLERRLYETLSRYSVRRLPTTRP